ncbi:hypothetical protein J22TS3_03830 [Paenibacillus sp. J22TS3]|nr:hypothetical protein J22TS3_03830 [Paenibacillus sp. J22TS3]
MLVQQESIFEQYKAELYRIAWRLQYKAKVIRRRETSFYDMEPADTRTFTTDSDNKIVVDQLLSSLPAQGRTILRKLYMENRTEKEVACQLKISQQAVSKWKKKMIQQLSRTMCS